MISKVLCWVKEDSLIWLLFDSISMKLLKGRNLQWLRTCSVQFSSVAQSCPTLCNPMNCSMPGLPVHHQFPEFTQTHIHRVCDAIQPSHPLLSPSPPAPNPSQHQSFFPMSQLFAWGGQSTGVSGPINSRFLLFIYILYVHSVCICPSQIPNSSVTFDFLTLNKLPVI